MSDISTTSVLLIDGSKTQRTYWADQLRRCSASYEIVEASDVLFHVETSLPWEPASRFSGGLAF